MSSQPTQQAIVHLYRSYLRVVNKWPTDHIRPNRNLKTALRSQVDESFRSTTPLSADTLAARLQDGQRQLDALKRIANNEFKQKYPLSPKLLTPASNPNYYTKLVDMLEKETSARTGGKKGFFGRMFSK
ncbi:hypothetical protein BGZ73_005751 [Actinomortierella ambigua]|nr:hypothetical protein BGZ73_005751 [Actinomortierella ambigua]